MVNFEDYLMALLGAGLLVYQMIQGDVVDPLSGVGGAILVKALKDIRDSRKVNLGA